MNFWKNAAGSVTKAVDFIVDKNRRAAIMNRLKIVIRSEKEAQNHAYAQLGKYYYENMRDPENGDTEPYCTAVDTTAARLKRAYAKLDELAVPTEPTDMHGSESDECGFGDYDGAEDGHSPQEPADDGTGFRPDDAAHSGADGGFHPDEALHSDDGREEAADEDQDYLHPFSVIPNDGTQEEPDEEEPGGENKPEK